MANHKIEIGISRNGLLRCQPEARPVRSGDTVTWHCQSYDYAVQFANHASPFGPEVNSFSRKKGSEPVSFTVKKGKQLLESYKYSVSVHIPGNDVPILIVDPIIIVDDEG